MKKLSIAFALMLGVVFTTETLTPVNLMQTNSQIAQLNVIAAEVSPRPGFTGPSYYFETNAEAEAFYFGQDDAFRRRYRIIYW